MAKCEACGREMLTAKGCAFKYVKTTDGKYYKRLKFGEEGWAYESERCGDCGAMPGNYHHPGCDIERCPICGCQLLSCSCDIEAFITKLEDAEKISANDTEVDDGK